VRVHQRAGTHALVFLGREPLVPRAWTIKHGVEALNDKPVGTGPWKLVAWKRKDHMLFERHDGYWGTPGFTKRLRLQVIPEAAARIAALRASQVHLVEAVPPLDASAGANPAVRARLQRAEAGLPRVPQRTREGGVRVRHRDGVFADPRVRVALNLAVNREASSPRSFTAWRWPTPRRWRRVATAARSRPIRTIRPGPAPCSPRPGWSGEQPLTLQLLLPTAPYTARPSTRR
jgi:ABC-type transport system substrate-binding protein